MPSSSCIQPKPAYGRPPIEPPIRTTFDGFSGGEDDPLYKQYIYDVRLFLRNLDRSPTTSLLVMQELIRIRIARIELELRVERLMEDNILPPLIGDFHNFEELFPQSSVTNAFINLLDELYEADQKVSRRLFQLENGSVENGTARLAKRIAQYLDESQPTIEDSDKEV